MKKSFPVGKRSELKDLEEGFEEIFELKWSALKSEDF